MVSFNDDEYKNDSYYLIIAKVYCKVYAMNINNLVQIHNSKSDLLEINNLYKYNKCTFKMVFL